MLRLCRKLNIQLIIKKHKRAHIFPAPSSSLFRLIANKLNFNFAKR